MRDITEDELDLVSGGNPLVTAGLGALAGGTVYIAGVSGYSDATGTSFSSNFSWYDFGGAAVVGAFSGPVSGTYFGPAAVSSYGFGFFGGALSNPGGPGGR